MRTPISTLLVIAALALAGCAGQPAATTPATSDPVARVPVGAPPAENEAARTVPLPDVPSAGAASSAAAAPDAPVQTVPEQIPVDVPPRALADFSRALDSMRAGRTEDAELELRQLTDAYPQLVAPQANLGLLYRKAGRMDDAVQALRASVERRPTAPVLSELGVTLRMQGRFADAASAYEQAIAVDPAYAPAHRNFAVLLDLYLGDAERALGEMERYKELAGDDKTVDSWLAELRQRTGKTIPRRSAPEADAAPAPPESDAIPPADVPAAAPRSGSEP